MSDDEDGVRASRLLMDPLKANGIMRGKHSAGLAGTTPRHRGHVFSGGQPAGHFLQRATLEGTANHWPAALRPATKRHSQPRAMSSGDITRDLPPLMEPVSITRVALPRGRVCAETGSDLGKWILKTCDSVGIK